MNFKSIALVALSGLTMPSKVWSLEYTLDNSPNKDVGTVGNAQAGPNCRMSATTTCTVDFTNIDGQLQKCEDFFIKRSECQNYGENGLVDVTMTFEVCNYEGLRGITPIADRTEILMYNEIQSLDTSHLDHEFCRDRKLNMKIDTCARSVIVGSIKVEGLSDELPGDEYGLDYYCYAWSFYKTKIILPEGNDPSQRVPTAAPNPPITKAPTPLPTPQPTPQPTPFPDLSYEHSLKCFLEDSKGSDSFTIPCGDFNFMDKDSDQLIRDVRLEYNIKNKSNEPLQLPKLVFVLSPLPQVDIVGDSTFFTISPNDETTFDHIFRVVNFADYSDASLTSIAMVDVVGAASGNEARGEVEHVVSVPNLAQISMDNVIECYIGDESGQTCSSLISSLSPDANNCEQSVVFQYTVRNEGYACDKVEVASGNIAEPSVGQIGTDTNISLANIDFPERNLCPGDSINILQRVNPVNLCELSGKEVEATVTINDVPTFGGFGTITMEPSDSVGEPTPPDDDFGIIITNAACFTFPDPESTVRTTCQDYVDQTASMFRREVPQECMRDVEFTFTIENTSTDGACRWLDKTFETVVNGLVVDIQLDDSDRLLCNDPLTIIRPEGEMNVCAFPGQTLEFVVEIDGKQATASVQFPFRGSVSTLAPTPAPIPARRTLAPTPAPSRTPATTGTQHCSSRPDELTFKLTNSECDESTTEQWDECGVRKRRLSRRLRSRNKKDTSHRGKGFSKKKKPDQQQPNPPATPDQQHPTPPATPNNMGRIQCVDDKSFNDGRNGPYNVIIRSWPDGDVVCDKKKIDFGETFTFGKSQDIPDDIYIEIIDKKGKLVQKSLFHTSCSTHMFIGEKFGALTLVGFDDIVASSLI